MTKRMRRLPTLALTVLLTLLTFIAPARAAAGSSEVSGAAIEPLATGAAYPASLNARIREFDQQLSALPTQKDLDDQQSALDKRTAAYNEQSRAVLDALDANDRKIDVHNAEVAQYPDGAPPSVADALNAEAEAINGEQQRLKDQAGKIADEGDSIKADQKALDGRKSDLETKRSTLRTTRGTLIGEMATALVALLAPPPPGAGRADGGDQAHSAAAAPQVDGGDSVSGATSGKPLDQYADHSGEKVDKRPVTAVVDPDAVSRVSADDAGALPPVRFYNGLVKKSDGTYRALYLSSPDQKPTKAETAFDDTVSRGAAGVAFVDGKKFLITDVQPVDAPTSPQPDQQVRNLALGLSSGGVKGFAEEHGFEHLMRRDITRAELRRETLGRLNSPNYQIHFSLKDMSKTDYPNILLRGYTWEKDSRWRGKVPQADGKILPFAEKWEFAPSVTDWELYMVHTLPGVLERTTFYDENGNVMASSPFLPYLAQLPQ
ncbi:hypothetical protein HUT16_02655 [Kitasatospora sp. NA04385]|uniref:hypothetical protein n=1 Tax=Kitasatospora sp. NA04385 TaxID=2742135 RepID=UPI0015905F42|nr:hypothetical protein [Kitasatospora sp. NA04385]QKW18108.1 hypothetical protein HUT16_02655 [Kitasatospora sp. NA04385]